MSEGWRYFMVGDRTYAVTDRGRVARISALGASKFLKPAANKSGHLFVYLGRGNKRYVHRLVLEQFVGPAPEGHEALHADDNPKNNRLDNLRWGTRSDNLRAMHRALPKGAHSANVKKGWETRRCRA